MHKHFFRKKQVYFLKFLFLRPCKIENGNKTTISHFCFNPLNFVSLRNFVSQFLSSDNETNINEDSKSEVFLRTCEALSVDKGRV